MPPRRRPCSGDSAGRKSARLGDEGVQSHAQSEAGQRKQTGWHEASPVQVCKRRVPPSGADVGHKNGESSSEELCKDGILGREGGDRGWCAGRGSRRISDAHQVGTTGAGGARALEHRRAR
eukprot:scaffold235548_cov27-Tisochrysis_lutea.AAC.5